MILYHGTNTEFQQIRLDMSRVGKDFGFGFYLTTDKQVATRQAERKLLQYGTGAKIVIHRRNYNESAVLARDYVSPSDDAIFLRNGACN